MKTILRLSAIMAVLAGFLSCSDDELNPQELPEVHQTAVKQGKLLDVEKLPDVTAEDFWNMMSGLVPQVSGIKTLLQWVVSPKPLTVTRIIYATPGPDGAMVQASGIIALQASSATSINKIISLQHGTCDIADAPSFQKLPVELMPLCIENRAEVPVVVMADYLGYGRSETPDLQHPYMHSDLTGSCCADMLVAAEEYLSQEYPDMYADGRPEIDLMGYSQGGAATLSLLLELVRRGGWSDRIDEVWSGAGPHDLKAFFDSVIGMTSFARSGFIPYTIRGLCYGNGLKPDLTGIYAPALLAMDPEETIFSKTQLSTWNARIGYLMRDILHPDFWAPAPGYNGNKDVQMLMKAISDASVVNCPVPEMSVRNKVQLYHSPGDRTVPYACSQSLDGKWNCGLQDLTSSNDHVNAGIEFMLRYFNLWDSVGSVLALFLK